MGIQGLLPLLKSIMLPVHAKDLEGCCVAVDTYSWLHKGALSCSRELCKGIPTSKHINYCMHRVNLLRHYGVKPILVFDGGFLPMKGDQESKRARVRKESLSRAIEHESNGNQTAAYECYQKAVDISPSVAYDLIQVLKQECVQYVVAPYEADAEMTLLAVTKQVDAVITEDSDLIAFGCPRIIYKMDKYGQGVEFQFSMLQQNKELNFTGFTKQMVLEMCILSGCDYLQSLPGMGLKKAHALMKKFRSYDKVIKHLRYSTVAVPPFYEESFKKAIMTFLHQRVYDPVSEELVHLSEVPAGGDEDLEFLGPVLTPEVAKGIARGELDPLTKMPFQKDIDGTTWNYTQSNQQKIFKPEVQRNKPDLPAQKNLLTKYFCIASIEAKQEFRAPWVVPIHSNLKDGSPSALLDSFTEDDSCELGSSSVSPPVREDENNVDDIASATGDCHLESTSNGIREELVSDDQGMHNQTPFRHSICKPCVLLHKDRASSRSKSKTIITENGKVVVRSSYFLPKKTEKENISDGSANDICKSTISAEECPSASVAIDAKTKTVNPITTLKSFEFQCDSTEEKYNSKMKSEKKKIVRSRNSLEDVIAAEVDETVKPESSLHYNEGTLTKQKDTEKELKASCNTFGDSSPKDHCKPNFAEECPSASVAIEGKMKTVDPITTLRSFEFQHTSAEEKNNSKMKSEKRKVVRSSYFQQQVSSNGNIIEDAIAAEVDETSENCLRHSEGNLRKRKVAFNNANENDTVKGLKASRNTFGDSSSNNKFDPAFDNYDSTGEVKADNMKFGSDVSHLGKYGEISEKSVEKFVSVISSFKFTSNGSRASGLRAPLKDIRNVSKSSSPREMDLDRFVYLPTKQKPYSARRKT